MTSHFRFQQKIEAKTKTDNKISLGACKIGGCGAEGAGLFGLAFYPESQRFERAKSVGCGIISKMVVFL